MSLPVVAVRLPSNLVGQENGKLDPAILTPVDGGGQLHVTAARAWRALVAEAAKAGHQLTYTIGGTYRSYMSQVMLFKSRYTTDVLPGRPSKMWNGQRWYQKPGTAMAAVPGTSNHGYGLAIDTALGAKPTVATTITPILSWMLEQTPRFGFSYEAQSEPWHIRYVAGDLIPRAVLDYERPPASPPAPDPIPVPTEGDPVLIAQFDDQPGALVYFGALGWRAAKSMTEVGELQFLGLAHYQPDGKPWTLPASFRSRYPRLVA